jgi:hypothetical protein
VAERGAQDAQQKTLYGRRGMQHHCFSRFCGCQTSCQNVTSLPVLILRALTHRCRGSLYKGGTSLQRDLRFCSRGVSRCSASPVVVEPAARVQGQGGPGAGWCVVAKPTFETWSHLWSHLKDDQSDSMLRYELYLTCSMDISSSLTCT